MPEFSNGDWVKNHTRNWSRWLKPFTGLPAVRALEIGSFEGRSALWFMENVLTHPSSHLLCMDPWASTGSSVREQKCVAGTADRAPLLDFDVIHDRFVRNTRDFAQAGRLSFQRGTSREEFHKLPLMPLFDFVYIDGEHLAAWVLEDSIMAWWRLRPGGVMIWDDYRWRQDKRRRKRHLARPKIAIDAFLRIYDERYDLLSGWGWQVAIQKR